MPRPADPPSPTLRRALFAIFFLSGAAALVYQVLWVRLLVLVFGATSQAMAVVLAVFMAGLGLGSLVAGRFADRIRSPIRAYAVLEAIIAAFGLAVPYGVPLVDSLQGALLGPDASAAAVLAVEVLFASLLLIGPTSCMGATLPILSSWIARDEATRGRDLGTLYALNTLGAFTGTCLAGFLAIELLGIATTNALAAGANLLLAGAALALARRETTPKPVRTERAPAPVGTGRLLVFAAAAGALGLAHEVVWTRLIGLVVWTTVYAYTTILATVIGGIGVGSILGARVADRAADPVRAFGRLQLGIGLAAFAIFPLLLGLLHSMPWVLQAEVLPFAAAQAAGILVCVAVVALPSVLMGATFPALARAVTAGTDAVGEQVGRLYVANTLGGVAGSFVGGFLLIPKLGVLGALSLLAGSNVLLGVWTARPGAPQPGRERAWGLGLLGATLAVAGLGAGRLSVEDLYELRLPEGSTILEVAEGITSTVMVADHAEDPPVRRIWIQSAWVAGSGGGHVMLGHLGALHAPGLERGLGIAFGTGQTFAAVARHGLKRLDCVDLNPDVVRAGARWFADGNDRLLEQPGVHVVIDDGRSFLARTEATYDLVVMEPLQPWSAGAVNLYTREFYELVAARLRPGGSVTQWMPLDDVTPETTRSVVATMAAVFPNVRVFLDHYDLVVVGRASGAPVELADWRERISVEPVASDFASIDYDDLGSVLSTLLLGPSDTRRWAEGAELLLDDRPFMEFQAPRVMLERWLGPNVEALIAACGEPLEGLVPDPETALPTGLSDCTLQRAFARHVVALWDGDTAAEAEHAASSVRAAPTLARARAAVRGTTWRAAARASKAGRVDDEAAVYRRHIELEPAFLGAHLNLALLEARRGRKADAIAVLEAVEGEPGELAGQIAQLLAMLRAEAE